MAIDGEKFKVLSTANRLIMNGKNRGNAERMSRKARGDNGIGRKNKCKIFLKLLRH